MMEPPLTAWALEARRFHDETGCEYQTARRLIARAWLFQGDTRPVQELLYHGEPLDPELSRLLAVMMDPDWNKVSKEALPFELKAGRRDGKAGRSLDLERGTLKRELADQVRAYMDTGISYEGAIATVVEENPNAGMKAETLRKEYGKRHGRKAKGRK